MTLVHVSVTKREPVVRPHPAEIVADLHNRRVLAQAVLDVLSSPSDAGCRACVAGGWGVDALVGAQTREHGDLDLAVDTDDELNALTALDALGYVIETDWRPARVELTAPGSRCSRR